MRQRLTLTALLLLLALGACGTRGPLTLPPQQAKLVTTPTPDGNAKPANASNDSNTPKGPIR